MAKKPLQFRALSSLQKIDREARVIHGVSVMTVGPAIGHGLTVDRKGLEQCNAACIAAGDEGVKLVINHDSGFEEIVGAVKNFRIEGDQLLGDAHILNSAPQRDRIFELAEKLPSQFGLSVETWGEDEKISGSKEALYRCAEIDAIALVPNPAANARGLFSKIDTPHNQMDTEEIQNAVASAVAEVVPAAVTTAVESVVEPIKEEMKALSKRFKKLEEGDEKQEEEKKDDDKLAKLGAAIAAEASEVTAKALENALNAQGYGVKVLVGRAKYNDGAKDKVDLKDVWGSSYIWVGCGGYRNETADEGIPVLAGAIATAYWQPFGLMFGESYEEKATDSVVVRGKTSANPTVFNSNAGTLIATQYA